MGQFENFIEGIGNASTSIASQTGFGVAQNGQGTRSFPSKSGFGVRQSSIGDFRPAVIKRQMVRWLLPETGVVEMYINPNAINYNYKKTISQTRTRNGFVIQYWGPDLPTLNISGTTGTSGIEGINVLEDIYLNEQLSMDPLALAVEARRQQEMAKKDLGSIGDIFSGLGDVLKSSITSIGDTASSIIQNGNVNPTRPRPSLASMAGGVEMYWSGWVFRGFFTSFTVKESADKVGLYDYTLEFTVTQRRGVRLNSMPWHRSPLAGPSNPYPETAVYSFATDYYTQSPNDSSASSSTTVVDPVLGVNAVQSPQNKNGSWATSNKGINGK